MSKKMLSLASLREAHAKIFGKGASGKAEEGTGADKGTEEGDDKGDDADPTDEPKGDDAEPKDEPKGDEGKEKSAAEPKADDKPKGVFLSQDDYTVVTQLASEAVSLRAENKDLKAKAEQWDSYQAALKGIKPGADSAGAKTTEDEGEGKDPHADLRKKHARLMEGL